MNIPFDPIVSEFESASVEAEYNAWLQQKVAKVLESQAPTVSHDEAMARIKRTLQTLAVSHRVETE